MRAAALIAHALLALAACQRPAPPSASPPTAPATAPPQRSAAMSMDPAVFEQVVPGHHTRNAASPAPPPDPRWRGALLAAPRVVRARAGRPPVVPLCIYHMIDVPSPPAGPPRVVVSGHGLRDPLTAPLLDVDESPEAPPPEAPPPSAAELRGLAVGGFANHDLAALVRLPAGVYAVRVEYGAVRSNEVTIEVAAQP